jgi:hypothetical protein
MEAANMGDTVSNATKLMPIVEKAVRALYGKAVQNVRIMKAEQFPLFKEPKQGWLVHAEFEDEKYEYSVQMDIQMADGRITRSVELHRIPLGC